MKNKYIPFMLLALAIHVYSVSSLTLENVYNHYRGESHKAPSELTICLRAAQNSHKVPITTIDKLYAADFEFLSRLNTLTLANKKSCSETPPQIFPRSLTQGAKRLYYQAEQLVSQLL